jgi:hypothetical protein
MRRQGRRVIGVQTTRHFERFREFGSNSLILEPLDLDADAVVPLKGVPEPFMKWLLDSLALCGDA